MAKSKDKYTVTPLGKKSKVSNYKMFGYDKIDLSKEQSQKVLKIIHSSNPELVTVKGEKDI